MTDNKKMILESLEQDEEALTQIEEYLRLSPIIDISREEVLILLNELIKEGYVFIDYSWKTEKNEYPYVLTEKGKELLKALNEKS